MTISASSRQCTCRARKRVCVCSLRVAVNDRVKDPTTGEWGDKPNYFDVDVFGAQGERRCGLTRIP